MAGEDINLLSSELRTAFNLSLFAPKYLEVRRQFKPSMIAAAIILTARRNLNLPEWPYGLKTVTSYSLAEIDCINFELTQKRTTSPQKAKMILNIP